MIDNIITLAGKFKSEKELQEYCDKQYVALQKASEKISAMQKEVDHLKRLLTSTAPLVKAPETMVVSPEETICDIQINILKNTSMQGELTLEEIKKLDLLIKNKRLAKEQSTTILASSKNLNKEQIIDAQLLQIAAKDLSNEP